MQRSCASFSQRERCSVMMCDVFQKQISLVTGQGSLLSSPIPLVQYPLLETAECAARFVHSHARLASVLLLSRGCRCWDLLQLAVDFSNSNMIQLIDVHWICAFSRTKCGFAVWTVGLAAVPSVRVPAARAAQPSFIQGCAR